MAKTKKQSDKEALNEAEKRLKKAAKKIENAGLKDYVEFLSSPWRVFGINFLVGTARGLGLIIGVSVVLAVVGYVLSQILVDLPIVGDFFSSLYDFLKANGLPTGAEDPSAAGSMDASGASSSSSSVDYGSEVIK